MEDGFVRVTFPALDTEDTLPPNLPTDDRVADLPTDDLPTCFSAAPDRPAEAALTDAALTPAGFTFAFAPDAAEDEPLIFAFTEDDPLALALTGAADFAPAPPRRLAGSALADFTFSEEDTPLAFAPRTAVLPLRATNDDPERLLLNDLADFLVRAVLATIVPHSFLVPGGQRMSARTPAPASIWPGNPKLE